MRSVLDEFETVRALCKACGWFRIVGYSGCKGAVRALIRLGRARTGNNVLEAKVLEVPADVPSDVWSEDYPGHQDLENEAQTKGLFRAMSEFDHLFANRSCPRCGRIGNMTLDQYKMAGGDPRLTTDKAWRVIRRRG